MKYTVEITIHCPINNVVDAFIAVEDFPLWQDGFQRYELLEGNMWQNGSKATIEFEQKGQKIRLEETILENHLPAKLKAKYVHKHMENFQTTFFIQNNAGQTTVISEVEYTVFKGFLPKLMAWAMPKVFEKQSLKRLHDFKLYLEKIC